MNKYIEKALIDIITDINIDAKMKHTHSVSANTDLLKDFKGTEYTWKSKRYRINMLIPSNENKSICIIFKNGNDQIVSIYAIKKFMVRSVHNYNFVTDSIVTEIGRDNIATICKLLNIKKIK